ncbi:protein RETICULATA-RELATED 3, chloroplastic-like [Phalaenopsis equestris]|uniref:protein RETICULATA-RELATED 3, chloroplastic-like n=1 Tax=Phalaenopsis equestris TaxID=78828 RepID=UPI0009E44F69|nr:protein RETICULATA-RELATED 3, chloroplastic-like [Phalaenopsis equestris]
MHRPFTYQLYFDHYAAILDSILSGGGDTMAAQLRFSPLQPPVASFAQVRRSFAGNLLKPSIFLPTTSPFSSSASLSLVPRSSNPNLSQTFTAGGGGIGGGGLGGSGGGGGDENDGRSGGNPERSDLIGPIGLFVNGWRARVLADPQFPFKVLMEEVVGVSACVFGDMASRPNFGLNELDFVFCTLVVGCIVNFVLMYLLAPTTAVSSTAAAAAASLPSYMFEPGAFSLAERIGTFAYKGATFAAVGFAAGLAGTAISNGLISLRKKMDPEFETPNQAPPTVLNAITWALHMGLSSNIRYQTLNGLEFVMEKVLPPVGFKSSVVVLRGLNNVLGGMSFVLLARLTGSQKVVSDEAKVSLITDGSATDGSTAVESEDGELQRNDSNCK